jgi:oxygen-independent coproporphyrinogen-3 oxidase
MRLYLIGHDYKYAVEQILQTVFPGDKPEYPEEVPAGDRAEVRLSRGSRYMTATCLLVMESETYHGLARTPVDALTDPLETDRQLQRIIKLCFYRAALKKTGKKPVWGALTGIRPGRLLSMDLEKGMDERTALHRFCTLYDVDPSRAELCLDTSRASLAASKSLGPGDICLYIGIPFCPTRCAYCSFVSQAVAKSMKLIPPFLEALFREVEATGQAVRALGLSVVSIYMGGGTPTTLSAAQLDALCGKLEKNFDLSRVRDYTVEAGRPDTIELDKLQTLRAHGVNRVSVNPQTMEDKVLEAIGRHHTAADVLVALDKVRQVGGFEVNMDLIAGLPEDSVAGFSRTLDTVLGLAPENITVHTLALKRGSRITLEGTRLPTAEAVGEMLELAQDRLRGAGYVPYYLYRQKFMSGGFENVGWSRPGTENLYNICIMEELCTILSMGGGASTKLVTGTGRIERMFCPKYPLEYIEKIDRVIRDKEKIIDFYRQLKGE